jgi:hypothetical protein
LWKEESHASCVARHRESDPVVVVPGLLRTDRGVLMLKNTTREGELLDYAFLTQISERRIQDHLDSQWEAFAKVGRVTARMFIYWSDFENYEGVTR